jgi:hypothetical protein
MANIPAAFYSADFFALASWLHGAHISAAGAAKGHLAAS